MNYNLRLLFRIPVIGTKSHRLPAITFQNWLPVGEEQGLLIENETGKYVFWTDKSNLCFDFPPDSVEDFGQISNIEVTSIFLSAYLRDVSIEVLKFISGFDGPRVDTDVDVKSAHLDYDKLMVSVFHDSRELYNRLIGHLRSAKGQYWLDEYEMTQFRRMLPKNFLGFSFDGRIVKSWRQPHIPGGAIYITPHERYITRGDWQSTETFLMSKSRPALVGELLSGSETLCFNGYYRNSLVEAVSALDVAINSYSPSIEIQERWKSAFKDRVRSDSLGKHIEHLGLTISMSYLIPILFDEEVLPAETIRLCGDAIRDRNNMVHGGQRTIKKDKLISYIHSIRKVCAVLGAVEYLYDK